MEHINPFWIGLGVAGFGVAGALFLPFVIIALDVAIAILSRRYQRTQQSEESCEYSNGPEQQRVSHSYFASHSSQAA